MRLGSIADSLAAPADLDDVVISATRFLESRGVELIVANRSHAGSQRAMRAAGFLSGPSNFHFAASKPLAAMLRAKGVELTDMHWTRGDGDGPINL